MESLKTKDFIYKLYHDNLKPGCALFGLVKKADNESKIAFMPCATHGMWIEIPVILIELATVLKNVVHESVPCTLVKLQLHEPENTEGKALYNLLCALLSRQTETELYAKNFAMNYEGKYTCVNCQVPFCKQAAIPATAAMHHKVK